ncbi:hypothetical protein O181_077616 [Austropuccinia psidii MF-1]|uniref:Uncharacterized protein n=1 Tax=Austropuccinia psidii MF-1 TaxID=1389203 RepID=A0A9Q3FCN1_9BASI|nr:hypothetical protein [Austropuccinia psidii MF-1]
MSPLHFRDFGIPRNQKEDIEGLSGTRRCGRGHHGHSSGWKDTEGNHTHSDIHLPIQKKPQTRGLTWRKFLQDMSQKDILERPYGNHQRLESHQAVHTPVGMGNQDKGDSSDHPNYK